MEGFRLKQLVTFSILMEENGGIVKKVPDCVLGQYDAVMSCKSDYELVSLLNSDHNKKYKKWLDKWILR